MSARGLYVAVEGLDGSGGTTQIALLTAALAARGAAVVRTREPSDGPIGRLIRQLLPGQEVSDRVLPYLFAADRQDHYERVVRPAAGQWVISDRCLLSSLAYQSLAYPTLDEGLRALWALNQAFTPPDVTLFLALPPAACMARIEARGAVRDRFETLERLEATEAAYRAAMALCRARGDTVVEVDASAAPEAVHREVCRALGLG